MDTTQPSFEELTEVTIDSNRNIIEVSNTFGSKFQISDWVVFSLMLVVSVAIGVISAVKNRKNVNTEEFLLGGKNMPPLAVAISLLGGIISAISILGKNSGIYHICVKLGILSESMLLSKLPLKDLLSIFFFSNIWSIAPVCCLRSL